MDEIERTVRHVEVRAIANRAAAAEYVQWFAWHPMKTETGWAWLRYIERKRVPFGWFVRNAQHVPH